MQDHIDLVFFAEVRRQTIGTIDRAVLPTRATKVHTEVGEITGEIDLHGFIHQGVDVRKKLLHPAVFLQKINHQTIPPCQFFVGRIAARIVERTTIKYIAATVARRILRNAMFVRKAIDAHGERLVGWIGFSEQLQSL